MSRAAAVRVQEIDLSTRVASFAGVFGAIVLPTKKGASTKPVLCVNDRQVLDRFTPNGRVEVGYDLAYFSALTYLERSDKLWVQPIMKNANFAGATVEAKASEESNTAFEASVNMTDPAQFVFADDTAFMLYASSPGLWGNDIGFTVITYEENPDLVGEPECFILRIYKKGYEGSPVEQFTCSLKLGKLDGYGRNVFIEDVLQQSGYVRAIVNEAVETVYPKSQATILFMTRGTDGLAITDADMIAGAQAFRNPDELNVTLLLDGGYAVPAYQIALDTIAKNRMDCVAILSTPYEAEVSSDYLNNILQYRKDSLNLNSSYSALYTPHLQIADRFNDRKIWIAPDGFVAGSISFTANSREIWFPAAGFRRGVLNVLDVARTFESGELDSLYNAGINPIKKTAGRGIVIWGQKTLLSRPSALSRLNVRLLLVVIEPALKEFLEDYLFEFNDAATRSEITTKIESYLEGIKGRRGVFDYKVVCDETNNTAQVIDNNQLYCDVYIKPNQSVEEIPLRIVIVANSVSFSDAAQSV